MFFSLILVDPTMCAYIQQRIRCILISICYISGCNGIYIKGTHNWSGVFPKLRIAMAFLKFVEIAMVSIQLTLK
jgi:hypothetical protein